nr:Putative zinc-finger [uncultured bacterium]
MNDLEIASYLDRGLSAHDRSRVEDHLAECFECRENVAGAQQLVAKLRRPRRIAALAGVLAVAAAALFVISPALTKGREPMDIVTREATRSSALAAYSPIAAPSSQRPLRFVWGAAPEALSYRFTLSSADGTKVWSTSGPDTTAMLPANVTLAPTTKYLWFADAILPDGSSRSTGLIELSR